MSHDPHTCRVHETCREWVEDRAYAHPDFIAAYLAQEIQ